jgi:hypothetical protein
MPRIYIKEDDNLSYNVLRLVFLDHGFMSMVKPEKTQEWKILLKI